MSRLIVAITGASGIIYGVRLLQMLHALQIETHLIVSKAAHLTRAHETSMSATELKALANVSYAFNNIAAPIASGSFKTMGMIVAPCSMKTLGDIAHGVGGNLITRAADVILKERRRLVLLPRESPLHQVHLQNMLTITQMGGIICPANNTFYHQPQTIMDLVDDSLHRILNLFDLDCAEQKRWGE